MGKDNQTIKCDVDECRHYEKKCCTLGAIKVAPCKVDSDVIDDGTKEATMCDSFEAE